MSAVAASMDADAALRQYICRACGLIYDEAQGDPDSGLPPGTRFDDIPDDWECPLCGVTKADFEPHVVHARTAARTIPAPLAGARRTDPGIVIVGAGAAGWQMAAALRECDPAVPLTLVTGCSGDVYEKPKLSIAFSRSIDVRRLVSESGQQAAGRLGIRLLADTHAISIDVASKTLRTTRGPLPYRDLVLAHGAQPRPDDALPPDLCWRINDLRAYARFRSTLGALDRTQRIVVAGAGLVGAELANDLATAGHQVTLLDVAARPLAHLLDAEASQALIQAWGTLAIAFIGGTRVTSVTRAGEARTVATDTGLTLLTDHVIAATGLQTPSRLAHSAGLAWQNGIAVNARDLRTSVPHIHALGDCVSVDGQAHRFIEPIARQARLIAARLTGGPALAYVHARPVVRVKTASRGFTV